MEKFDKFVVTKKRVFEIPDGVEAVPIEKYMPEAAIPDSLKGAVVYETIEGPVITLREEK